MAIAERVTQMACRELGGVLERGVAHPGTGAFDSANDYPSFVSLCARLVRVARKKSEPHGPKSVGFARGFLSYERIEIQPTQLPAGYTLDDFREVSDARRSSASSTCGRT